MTSRRSPLRALAGRFGIALGLSTVLMVGGVVAVNLRVDSKIDKAVRINVTTAEAPPEGANFLVIGSDTRSFVESLEDVGEFGTQSDAGGQRSDTLMVWHVEPEAKRTLVVSFPRDLWVTIPGMGEAKINGAFNEGPDKVIETLAVNFGIEINHYVEINFKSFQQIVDAVGTVPVYFPYPAMDGFSGLLIPKAGCNKLYGAQALQYTRARSLKYYSVPLDRWLNADATSDLGRIKRQQDFIRELAGIAVRKSLDNILTADKIADRIFENLTIDDALDKGDLLDLAQALRTVNPDDTSALEFQTMPSTLGTEGALSVLHLQEPEASQLAARLMAFTDQPAAPTVAPATVKLRVLNGTQRDGAAAATLTEFAGLGFKRGGTANDPRGVVSQTEVRYRPGKLDKGKAVLDYIDPAARLIEDKRLKGADVAVVLGTDFEAIVVPEGVTTTTPSLVPQPSTEAVATAPAVTFDEDLGPPAANGPPCI